jgi:universal stress protein A
MNGPRVSEILFPTDFSAVSAAAGRTAADFARHFGARLHVLHVVPMYFERDTARATLRNAVSALGADMAVTPVVESGLAARAIVAYAQTHPIDLIVMGTHGRTGFSHVLLGSVAEAVVRGAPCPVLTVPPIAVSAPQPPQAIPAPIGRCVVCAQPSPDLICGHCRARIRGEALERKWNDRLVDRLASR